MAPIWRKVLSSKKWQKIPQKSPQKVLKKGLKQKSTQKVLNKLQKLEDALVEQMLTSAKSAKL